MATFSYPKNFDISALAEAQSLAELQRTTEQLVHQLGFDFFIYTVRYSVNTTSQQLGFNNYPEDWYRHYRRAAYQHIDPAVLHCLQSVIPWVWAKSAYQTVMQQKLYAEAKQAGLVSGISFPTHYWHREVGLLCVASRQSGKNFAAHMQTVLAQGQYLALHIYQACSRLRADNSHENESLLSKRQLQCIYWVAQGKTAHEISQIINIADSTVIYHLRCAAQRLQVPAKREQIIARAIALGLVDLNTIGLPVED